MRIRSWGVLLLAAGLFFPSSDALATWSPLKRLTWNLGISSDPSIAVDSGNTIHVVWSDDRTGSSEIYYMKSSDEGVHWSPPQRLTWTLGSSSRPDIAIDTGDRIHVVWEDKAPGNTELFYRRSADAGATWSALKRLNWTSGYSSNPDLATDSYDTVHVVWHDSTPGNNEIYWKKGAAGGTTWSAMKRLTWNSSQSFYAAVALDSSDHIHVVWEDSLPGNSEIYYMRSTNGGSTWSTPQRLTWNSNGSYYSAIALDSSDHIHVVWEDYAPGNAEIYYKRSRDGGTTWSASRRLTYNSSSSFVPSLALDAVDGIHVVWFDSLPGNGEIYYQKSSDGGTSWSSMQRLTWTSGESSFPAVAVDSVNTLHIVWYDDTPGNYEIYYKHGS